MRCPIDARLAGVLMALLAAGTAAGQAMTGPARCDNCAVIVSIQVSTQEEQWTPLGGISSSASSLTNPGGMQQRSAIAFGTDGSRDLVMIGAAGGAVYAKRPNAYQKRRWDVKVKMDSGETRVIPQRYEPLLREGDRVRVLGTQLELADS
jgi:outer membrane lipoprotein SlyB